MNPSCVYTVGVGFLVYRNDLIWYVNDNGNVEHGLL